VVVVATQVNTNREAVILGESVEMRRTQWCEPGVSSALCWLAIDDKKGNPHRCSLPQSLYSDTIASFLHFDRPLQNQLYAVGGRNQTQGPLDTIEMFDTWHGKWVTCAPMAVRRAGCAAAVLPNGGMIVIGGYDESGIVKGLLSSCEIYDPATEKWDSSCTSLTRARWGHGCACLGGLVYVVGGCSLRPGAPPHDAFMETLRGCEVYNPENGNWSSCSDLNMARAGSRVVTLGDKYLAAVGGCDDVFGRAEMLPTVELFDISIGRWSLLNGQLSTPRTTAAVAAISDRRILVIGGAPSLSSAEVYHVPENIEAECARELAAEQEVQEKGPPVSDMVEGRTGCQAVALDLPEFGKPFPLCTRQCVLVVGGENGDDDWDYDQAHVWQFKSVLVYDVESDKWRPEDSFPPMPTARTAMALCVSPGRISGCQ